MKRSLFVAASVALLLSGCPRRVEHDAGVDSGTIDAGEEPWPGNSFEGPIVLDDARTRSVDGDRLLAGATPCRAPVLARVYHVADGDTIDVRGEDTVLDVPVRMIGIDTPEISHSGNPADCYGDEARELTQQLEGHLVWLTFDNSCYDPYDRLLAYVWIGGGEGDLWQRQLLRRGYATVFTVGDNRTYATMFEADEANAAMSGVGLWSACF